MTAALSPRVLLCDADGCLFPSEEPAFVASAVVTNRLLAHLGVERRFDADALRAYALGRNFRATATHLAREAGVVLDEGDLERRVAEERVEVTAHLGRVLRPDASVTGPLTALAALLPLALVSSSALARLDACLRATELATLFPGTVRFSAEDSLPVPASKPDPAVYRHAVARLGAAAADALAVEDSVTGARSAVGAGIPTVGLVQFVPPAERDARAAALREAGAVDVLPSWEALARRLGARPAAAAAAAGR
ncbi:MAG TPA: HAD-IA family hydrolase [Miltoncostaeaceae bacterium]|nr:HAD-IA family hydrolase [Miltoncostaeaceae bacterium]